MQLTIKKTSRIPRWPLWAVCFVVGWLSLVAFIHFYADGIPLCHFKRFTGFPCPTCGLTRGVDAFIHGDFVRPWLLNPFVFTLLFLWLILLLVRLFLGRKIELVMSRREKNVTWIVLLALLLVNWYYMIHSGV